MNETDKHIFWDNVEKKSHDNCWKWNGRLTRKGYGTITIRGEFWQIHRLAWTIVRGTIPNDLCVLHHCDNPGCCNPNHLFLGTPADNSQDMVNKKRQMYGEKNGRSKLTENDVLEIRKAWANKQVNRETTYTLGDKYEVSRTLIYQIVHRKIWRHI